MRALLLLALAAPSVALARPVVEVRATCPAGGAGDIRITGATPSGRVALARASRLGDFVIPSGGCAGTPTDLGGGATLVQVFTADTSGTVTFRPTLPAAACDAVLVAVDLSSCDTSEGVFVRPRDVPVDFTRSSSTIFKTGTRGTVASGLYQWDAGDYVEDTFTGTGLTSIRGLTFTLPLLDATSQYCGPVDRWQWSVSVNGTDVGDVHFPRGGSPGATTHYAAIGFPAVSAAPGGGYTIRLTSDETICGGGGSYQFQAGGETWLMQ
jgi:hypothetical protein